jgi:4-carboxymuconolactone decarboxylase
MKDLHKIFTNFKEEFPEVHSSHESLGKEIHEESGPLSEKIRWLIKIAEATACTRPHGSVTHG